MTKIDVEQETIDLLVAGTVGASAPDLKDVCWSVLKICLLARDGRRGHRV
jgi:hypothetical protein